MEIVRFLYGDKQIWKAKKIGVILYIQSLFHKIWWTGMWLDIGDEKNNGSESQMF